jgi:hypothetical protein
VALTVDTFRDGRIILDPPGSIQALITDLTALMNRNAVGPTAIVTSISGGPTQFQVRVSKADAT